MKRQLLNNALGTGFFHISSTLLVLLAVPVLVHGLGIEQYGFLALLAAASKYSGFTDFGIGPSLTRQVAHHTARDEHLEVAKTATFGLLFYSTLLTIATLVAIFCSDSIVALGHYRDPQFVADATYLLRIFIISFFAGTVSGSFQSLLAGIGRIALASKISAGMLVLSTGLNVLAVLLHLGLRGIADATALGTLIGLVVTYSAARKAYGRNFLVSPATLSWPIVKNLLSTGGWIQLSTIMVIFYAETDQLIVGAVIGLAASGLFDVGRKLARGVRAVSFYFGNALMPAVATVQSRGDDSMQAIVVDGTRYLSVITMFVTALLYVEIPNVLTLWIGPGAQNATIVHVVHVLLVVYLIDSLQGVSITALRGAGTPKLEAFYSVTNGIVNVALTIALVRPFGMNGILAGSLAGMTVASCVYSIAYCRFKHYDLRASLGLPLLRLASCTVVSVALVKYALHFVTVADDRSKVHAFIALLFVSIGYALVYVAVVRLSGVLSARDLAFVKASFPKRLGSIFEHPLVRGMFAAPRAIAEKGA